MELMDIDLSKKMSYLTRTIKYFETYRDQIDYFKQQEHHQIDQLFQRLNEELDARKAELEEDIEKKFELAVERIGVHMGAANEELSVLQKRKHGIEKFLIELDKNNFKRIKREYWRAIELCDSSIRTTDIFMDENKLKNAVSVKLQLDHLRNSSFITHPSGGCQRNQERWKDRLQRR